MPELIELLDEILRETRFDVGRYGKLTAAQMRSVHTQGNQSGQHITGTATVVAPAALLDGFVKRLDRELHAYIEPETHRIGTGLVGLMGGALDSAEPKVADFAQTLVRAAAILGSVRAVEILHGWIAGGPYHYRMMVLLTGVRCEHPLALEEGVRVTQLPTAGSVADLAPHLPYSLVLPGLNVLDFLGRAVLSIDCTFRPALYQPTRAQGDEPDRDPRHVWACGRIPCLTTSEWRERFFEALSLACNHHLGWTHIWRDTGDLRAFSNFGGGYESRVASSQGDTVSLRLEHLESARDLDVQRHADARRRRGLDLAIKRWMNSKRPGATLPDRFIDLRIALEALYLAGSGTEMRFRLAFLGAWHLGSDFAERRRYYDLLRAAYDCGSKAVHASDVEDTPKNRGALVDAQRACRKAILKRLAETDEPAPDPVDVALGG